MIKFGDCIPGTRIAGRAGTLGIVTEVHRRGEVYTCAGWDTGSPLDLVLVTVDMRDEHPGDTTTVIGCRDSMFGDPPALPSST